MGKDYIKQELDRAANNAGPRDGFDIMTPRGRAKYEARQREAAADRQLQDEWKKVRQLYAAAVRGKKPRVLTRELLLDPNATGLMDAGLYRRFLKRFQIFCDKFALQGMNGNQPLLLKPMAIITKIGTVVLYPKYWSIDSARDIAHKQLSKGHKIHHPARQGKTITEIRQGRLEKIRRVTTANREALAAGLIGKARWEYILRRTGLSLKTDDAYIRHLLRAGAKLEAEGKL